MLKRNNQKTGDSEGGVGHFHKGAVIEHMIVSALHQAFAQDAPLNTGLILDMIPSTPPWSVTMAERIEPPGCWTKNRCVPAE